MRSLYYSSMPLQRHADLRQKSEWLNAQLASDNAVVVALWSQQNLVRLSDGIPEPVYLPISDAALILGNAAEVIYLGHDDQTPVFAADMAELPEKRLNEILQHAAPGCEMVNLRRIGTLLEPGQASILALARAMAFWHQTHKFCSRCGQESHSKRGGHMRYCEACSNEIFPRIDPAVIMLVEQNDPEDGIARCLLGRHDKLPKRMYSTLAGFVDPVENLEQAVIREVYEEAGLRVSDLSYLASQPWPFPASMMFGFRAKTDDREITIDMDELEDAAWFTAEEIRAFGEFDGSETEIALPPKDSIARVLIDTWLEENP
ncbi:MAG: NAD(+) diphosphatase [bacterium]